MVDLIFERGELTHAEPSWDRALRVIAIWLPIWLGPVLLHWLLTGSSSVWTQLGASFSSMAVVTFGGAYAVLVYVARAAVDTFGWLAPGEMVDGLGLAETTPGPLIMVLQFVGFLAAHRAPCSLDPLLAVCLGGTPDHQGDLCTLLLLDIPRCALHRGTARQQGSLFGAIGDNRSRRGRDDKSRLVVRAACRV